MTDVAVADMPIADGSHERRSVTRYGLAPHCEADGPTSTCVPKYWTLVLEDGLKVGFEICAAWRGEKEQPTNVKMLDGSYWTEGVEFWQ